MPNQRYLQHLTVAEILALKRLQDRARSGSLWQAVQEEQERKDRKMQIIMDFIRGIVTDSKVRIAFVAFLGAIVTVIARQLGVGVP